MHVDTFAQDDENPTFPLETIYAKRKPWPMRGFLKNFKFSASIGEATTYFSHNLEGFGVFQRTGYTPRIFAGTSTNTLFYNWVNNVASDTVQIKPDSYLVSSDTAKLGFKGKALNIPLHVMVHYEFKNFRIGGGYGIEYMSIGTLHSKTFTDKIGNFRPTSPNGLMKKYYGFFGYSFYRWQDFLFTGLAQVGGYKPGRNFDMTNIKKGINVNLGVTVERELSEYTKLFIKPSFDIKSYNLIVPGSGLPIKHHMNAFYTQIGITFSIADLPKCFHTECKIQMNHAHGNREYRSRVHPFYKKQNPNYGENYPKLVKYKRKNKRKLNPY